MFQDASLGGQDDGLAKYAISYDQKFGRFYLNDGLSDFTLIDADTSKKYNCHRVVLAAASTTIRNFLSVADTTRLAEHNKASAYFHFRTPRRFVRQRISEEENIIFEQIILRYMYENQNFDRVRPLITAQRVASVLDVAIGLQINSLVQMCLIHLCENILPGSRILYGFDHSFFEFVFHYLDAQGIEWGPFKREVVKQLRLKFEDLMNFEQLVNLPARVFAEIV